MRGGAVFLSEVLADQRGDVVGADLNRDKVTNRPECDP